MPLDNYTRIILLTDSYANEGVNRGAVGYIIETYKDDEYEVEFSDPMGVTIVQIVVKQNEVRSVE